MQRTQFVFHVYVDPIYGDDNLASNSVAGLVFNPTPTGSKAPLTTHPDRVNFGPGYLQHAPYSFRTVRMALAYASQFQQAQYTGGPRCRPYQVPGTDRWINFVVIHCLPGLYGPGTDIDPESGLRWNGEQFPLTLEPRTGIQGTSELDTVFSGRSTDSASNPTTIFFVPSDCDCFIDSLRIEGVRTESTYGVAPAGAAIAVSPQRVSYYDSNPNVHVTQGAVIGNCVITDNSVGIFVASPDSDDVNDPNWHSPLIVNNTIAWNQVGVFCGRMTQVHDLVAWSRPRLLNNLFDSCDRFGRWGGVTSPFEGLEASDLQIDQVGGQVIPATDFNAYEYLRGNQGVAPPGWGRTRPRPPATTPVPRVDLTPYTGFAPPRGRLLFVSDTLDRGIPATSYSIHDFRLAPDVADLHANFEANPLVNQDTDTSASPGGTLRFANWYDAIETPLIVDHPGLEGPGRWDEGNLTEYAQVHAWDWDMEGFGNARIFPHPDYPAPTWPSTSMDIGADEMGTLIVAGFLPRTRIFSRRVPNCPAITDHTKMYFVRRWPPGEYLRPFFTSVLGGAQSLPPVAAWHWWDWVQATPGSGAFVAFAYPSTPPTTYYHYTVADPGMARGFASRAGGYPGSGFEPFMRNLECDVSPHLIMDLHSLWAGIFSAFPSTYADEFAANPWCHHPANLNWRPNEENWYLYYRPTANPPAAVIEATTTPSHVWVWGGYGPQGGYIGLFYNQLFTGFGGANPVTYKVTLWGLGDTSGPLNPTPDVVPDTQWLGMRFNLEERDISGNLGVGNLQTFLGINGVDPPDPKDLVLPKMPAPTAFDEKTRDRLLQSVKLNR